MKLNLLIFRVGIIAALLLAACSEPTTPEAPAKPVVGLPELPAKADQQISAKPSPKPAQPAVKPGQITGVDIAQLFTLSQTGRAYVIDTRPPLFFRLGHIDGAVSFPLIKYDAVLPTKRVELDAAVKAGKVIVAYCQNVNCPDAHKLATRLSKLGYNVSVYSGGWEEWKHSGMQP